MLNEPNLPLPHPHNNIILTPPRPNSDETALVTLLNSPKIYPHITTPPYPYHHDHAVYFLANAYAESARLLASAHTDQFVNGCPFTCIRFANSGQMIGVVTISRDNFPELRVGSEERGHAIGMNEGREVGGEGVIWMFGDYLSPSHHGKGIMTAVVRTIIHDWAIPRMNAHIIKASMHTDNTGSRRVFEKNQFRKQCTLEDWAVVPENRGGGRKSIHVMEWRREYIE
ncbi:hypothetical protein ASPWEDRAFT_712859 [Aspergillus wentii DTO 134E9]|uniref:N-acetyltransferase domain-containing protein n=1 Tax=Aspergillus wentii DTO 134E9 TaxID=1073089 RepID=A0A1L9R6D3_ASPWE|nr:uncharacterized protein ASPWEDRAFT_712859 [Aspergillus wentii DTO 134E9]KAI9926882.1 hypothetical protein MW887_003980 [Aspergillus wentii]OJJ30448.1 hypothetical protein ASPWEDRAFT_712859 [Aspergillus wentii DTO 134E9]